MWFDCFHISCFLRFPEAVKKGRRPTCFRGRQPLQRHKSVQSQLTMASLSGKAWIDCATRRKGTALYKHCKPNKPMLKQQKESLVAIQIATWKSETNLLGTKYVSPCELLEDCTLFTCHALQSLHRRSFCAIQVAITSA